MFSETRSRFSFIIKGEREYDDLCISYLYFGLDFNKKNLFLYFVGAVRVCCSWSSDLCIFVYLFSRRQGLILLVLFLSPVAVCSGESSPWLVCCSCCKFASTGFNRSCSDSCPRSVFSSQQDSTLVQALALVDFSGPAQRWPALPRSRAPGGRYCVFSLDRCSA
jgi:hypothetical protein